MLKNYFKILSYEEVISFGKAQRNRKVNAQHVNDFYNIIKDRKSTITLEDGTYLVFGIIPIVVNPITWHVLEGQHRLEAFKKAYENGEIDENARILVALWEIKDLDLENIITIDLNSKTKNWSVEDYMTSYAQYISYYEKLSEFCRTHTLCNEVTKTGKEKLKYRYAAAMITGKGQQTNLKAGTFSFTDEQFKTADTIHKELYDIRKKLNLPLKGDEIEFMAIEWHKQRNFISVSDIKALKYLPKSIREMTIANKGDWRVVFSQLKDIIQKEQLEINAA